MTEKITKVKKQHNFFDFEKIIEHGLKKANIPIDRLFIDKIDKKPFLRKITVRTKEQHHFRMVIGKQELLQGFQMFIVMAKARYNQAIKEAKNNDKPKNIRGVERTPKRKNGQYKKNRTSFHSRKTKIHGNAGHAKVSKATGQRRRVGVNAQRHSQSNNISANTKV